MLIIGTGGLASDMLITLCNEKDKQPIVLFNDTEDITAHYLKDHFPILTSRDEAQAYFKNEDARFIMAIGDNKTRERMTKEFIALGGTNPSFVSCHAFTGPTTRIAPNGVFIMQNTSISMNAQIDEGSIIYLASGIGHCSHIKKYTLVSSHVSMSNVTIGEYSTIGIGAKFKPGVVLGRNCMIGTGSVVSRSFGDDTVAYGIPAKKKKDEHAQE